MTSTRSVLLPTHPTARHPLTGDPLVALYVDRKGRARYPIMGAAPDDPPNDPAPSDYPPKNDPPADPPKKDPAPEPEKKLDLTQEKLDQIVSEAKAKEKKRFEEQLEQIKADAGKSEQEKLTAERDRYKQQAEGAGKAATERVAQAEAKLAANLLGGRDDRLTMILKQADLADVYDGDDVDGEKVKAAVKKVLDEFPEWKRTPGKSGGELGGGADGKKTWTRKQIEDMSPEEVASNIDELNEAAAEGRIVG